MEVDGEQTFRPTASWEALRRRAELLAELRRFFARHQFLEVETPAWSSETIVDIHLDPVPVVLPEDPRDPQRGRAGWLQTSPELHMKRLLAAGGEAIYQVCRVFRGSERGAWHNPEFTLCEWYRRGDDLEAAMERTGKLIECLLGRGPAERLAYREAFQKWAGVDPLAVDTGELAETCRRLQIVPPAGSSADRDFLLDLLLTECVQPQLGRNRPTLVYHYPASQAALARRHPQHPEVAERFELYVEGVELANGYHELLCPDELSERMERANRLRREAGKPELPAPRWLLEAMDQGLPSCSGVALGFDRLVMVALGATSIDQVLAFPLERA